MRHLWLLMAVVLVFVLFGCQPPAEEAAPPEMEAEEASMSDDDLLSAQADAFAAAWSSADAAGLAALFATDGDILDPAGVRFHGRDEIQAPYEDLFSGIYQGTTLTVTQSSARFPFEDSAIVQGSYEILGMKSPDGEDMTVKGKYTNLAVKENGEWTLHCVRPMIPIQIPVS